MCVSVCLLVLCVCVHVGLCVCVSTIKKMSWRSNMKKMKVQEMTSEEINGALRRWEGVVGSE